jgi:hypothetical protein
MHINLVYLYMLLNFYWELINLYLYSASSVKQEVLMRFVNCDVARPMDKALSRPPSPLSGSITWARAKALHWDVNSLLFAWDFNILLDDIKLNTNVYVWLGTPPWWRAIRTRRISSGTSHERTTPESRAHALSTNSSRSLRPEWT